jgi:hypothetical protein
MRKLIVVTLAFVAAGCGGGGEGTAPPPGRFVATSRTLTPNVHLFAEPVVARLDVVVDRRRIDPDRVRIRARFLPYELIGSVDRAREDFARFTRLRYEYRLRCLDLDCIPTQHATDLGAQESGRPERKAFRFQPARVLYDDPESGKPRQLRRVWWPPLESTSRINESDLFRPEFSPQFQSQWRSTLAPLPEPTYRVAPPLLAAAFIAGALALLALPAALVVRRIRSRRPPPPEPEPELPPLERALLLVEWTRGREDGEDRRKALELLAFELDALGRGDQARAARRLAWSLASPSPQAADEIVGEVKDGG